MKLLEKLPVLKVGDELSFSLDGSKFLNVNILVDIVCAPPALFIKDFVASKPAHVQVAAQNCYNAKEGAFTGEIR